MSRSIRRRALSGRLRAGLVVGVLGVAAAVGVTVVQLRPLPDDATAAELGRRFGACPVEQPDGGNPHTTLQRFDRWIDAVDIVDAHPAPGPHIRSEILTLDDRLGERRAVRVHESYRAGVEWALARDGSAFFAVRRDDTGVDQAVYVVAVGPAGQPFLPGECAYALLQQAAERSMPTTVLARIVERTPTEIGALLEQP